MYIEYMLINSIVYYWFDGNCVECQVFNKSISIKDAHLVRNDDNKREVITDLLNSFDWFAETRTLEDMLDEWKSHNILYQKRILRSRTRDTDLELKQSKFLKWFYKFVAHHFKEKITHE